MATIDLLTKISLVGWEKFLVEACQQNNPRALTLATKHGANNYSEGLLAAVRAGHSRLCRHLLQLGACVTDNICHAAIIAHCWQIVKRFVESGNQLTATMCDELIIRDQIHFVQHFPADANVYDTLVRAVSHASSCTIRYLLSHLHHPLTELEFKALCHINMNPHNMHVLVGHLRDSYVDSSELQTYNVDRYIRCLIIGSMAAMLHAALHTLDTLYEYMFADEVKFVFQSSVMESWFCDLMDVYAVTLRKIHQPDDLTKIGRIFNPMQLLGPRLSHKSYWEAFNVTYTRIFANAHLVLQRFVSETVIKHCVGSYLSCDDSTYWVFGPLKKFQVCMTPLRKIFGR
jgi:hypothetical protein